MGSRRQQIEDIIIGTLLCDTRGRNHFPDCQCLITADMFQDERSRRVFSAIKKMREHNLSSTTPLDVCQQFPEMASLSSFMCDVAIENDFVDKKVLYNDNIYLFKNFLAKENESVPPYTTVKFSDYVTALIKIVYSNAKQ